MELLDLDRSVKSIASVGVGLNCQEIVGITAGLTALKSAQKFPCIFFWGKVFGKTKDYYIAYGLPAPGEASFEFPEKAFFYATEDFEFQALPAITEDVAKKITALDLVSQLTGDPAAPLVTAPPAGEGEAPPEEPVLTEAQRLALAVLEIDFDTAVVPKGAYTLSEAHVVVPSGDFRGLAMSEAKQLQSYVHYRAPVNVASLRALARDDMHLHGGFLDPLAGDVPMGCWAVRQDPTVGLVTLRSLNWPGYVAFHAPSTARFGGAYFGYAQKDKDLAFLL